MSTLRTTLSGTPLEDELQTIERGLSRTTLDPELRFDASLYDPRVVARVASQWERRMVFEHRSSTAFTQLATQLFEANATLDAKIVMLRMAQDELRHTATCAAVIRALGGNAEPDADFTVEQLATHRGVSPEERALRNVIYTTTCSELVACARFDAGAVYLLDLVNGTLTRSFTGFATDRLGAVVATVGDVTGDGIPEIAIGRPGRPRLDGGIGTTVLVRDTSGVFHGDPL